MVAHTYRNLRLFFLKLAQLLWHGLNTQRVKGFDVVVSVQLGTSARYVMERLHHACISHPQEPASEVCENALGQTSFHCQLNPSIFLAVFWLIGT